MCIATLKEKPRSPGSFDKGDVVDPKSSLAYKRVKTIQIRKDQGINQIKFIYDDDSESLHGHEGGHEDSRNVIFTKDEHLVEVRHEEFSNFYQAGAAIAFVTNKGRLFEYKPKLETGLKDQITVLKARPGHQITALNINQGRLLSITQHSVPNAVDATKIPWYVVANYNSKSDDYDLTEEEKDALGLLSGCHFEDFHSYSEAKKAYNLLTAQQRKGNTVLLIDCKKMKTVKHTGKPMDVVHVEQEAISAGLILPKDKNKLTIRHGFKTLVSLLGENSDKKNFGMVLGLLGAAAYFDLYASLVTGKVLTMFDSSSTEEDDGKFDWVRPIYCLVGDCSGADANFEKKALILGYFIVMVMKSFLYVSNVYIHHLACDRKNSKMKTDCFDKVLSLDQAFFDTKSMAEIRSCMEVHSINNTITWNVPYLLARILKLSIAAYLMIMISVELALVAIISTVCIQSFILTPLSAKSQSFHRAEWKINIHLDQIKDEALDMASTIKMFSNEELHTSNYARGQAKYTLHLWNVVALRVIREFAYSNANSLTFAIVLYCGIVGSARESVTAASLTGFFLVFSECQGVFGSLKWHWEQFERDAPAIERFVGLMKEESKIEDKIAKELPKDVRGEILFDKVEFDYPSRPDEKTLKGLNLKIEPNKMTAIVGDSGAGKSTIIKMIMRTYDVKQGGIYIDGFNVKEVSLKSLHNAISIVPQTPDLFNASVADNISYGCGRKVTREDVIEAAKLANCYDFIVKLANGFETFVGNRGTQLSVGQKQRIAIARAAIRQPQILLLDEATSALDAENERLVQEALEKLMEGRTTIVVAHRLCTIQNADNVVCMKDGVVAESGTHAGLLAKKGAFYKLIQKQLQASEE